MLLSYLLTQSVISERWRYTRVLGIQQFHQIMSSVKPLFQQQQFKSVPRSSSIILFMSVNWQQLPDLEEPHIC